MFQLFQAKEKVQIPVHTESKQSQLLIPFTKEDIQPGMSILSPFQAQIVSLVCQRHKLLIITKNDTVQANTFGDKNRFSNYVGVS